MTNKEKIIFIVLVMIFLTGKLSGNIKVTGKLLIPTAKGERMYDSVITFTRVEICIECLKEIFQPFNEFDSPKHAKIVVNTAEIEEIQIQIQNKKIFIITKDSFTIRYRNIFNRASKIIGIQSLSPVSVENWALIFVVENSDDIKTTGEALIKIIGKQCEVRS